MQVIEVSYNISLTLSIVIIKFNVQLFIRLYVYLCIGLSIIGFYFSGNSRLLRVSLKNKYINRIKYNIVVFNY